VPLPPTSSDDRARHAERRGEEARRILHDSIYVEAFQALEQRWISEMAQQEIDPKRAEYLRTLIVAGRKHRQYMEQVMHSGTIAAKDIERKRSLRDRMLRRA
jgi:hypothetical protein